MKHFYIFVLFLEFGFRKTISIATNFQLEVLVVQFSLKMNYGITKIFDSSRHVLVNYKKVIFSSIP